jgi:hypothetical protein
MSDIATGFLSWLDRTDRGGVKAMDRPRESQLVRRRNAQTGGAFAHFAFGSRVHVARTIRIDDRSVAWRFEPLKYYGFAPL